ncbi:hypothetical protein HRbin30_02783 [bacterium HR30]|nr:hypothetical protein HRbin30_02783 [bacterium HR30]
MKVFQVKNSLTRVVGNKVQRSARVVRAVSHYFASPVAEPCGQRPLENSQWGLKALRGDGPEQPVDPMLFRRVDVNQRAARLERVPQTLNGAALLHTLQKPLVPFSGHSCRRELWQWILVVHRPHERW